MEFLGAWVPLVPVTSCVGADVCVLLTSDPMILGVLEHLGVDLPLGVVGLAAEFPPKVCSGHQTTLEGPLTTGQAEFLGTWVPLVPVTSCVQADVLSSSPLIL